ncbi:MAG: alpha/beta hydrolase [Deltaproteobacteria bacterium]|nr:MAG: alpha/beta hydrolase [Deltaproteobacteria bacterium]
MTNYSKIDNPVILKSIFFPHRQARTPLPPGACDLDVNIDDISIGCRFYSSSKEAPNILYFHGNGETVNDYNKTALLYNEQGVNILVTSYRGYGWSTGKPSVSALMNDAGELLDFAEKWLQENGFTSPLFVMGRSLGCASAIELAYNRPDSFKGLIIESGFADLAPIAKRLGIDTDALGFTEADGFNNRYKIGQITMPTFILHGQKDELIPIAEAERLQAFSGARNKQFHIIPGAGHNSMIETGGEQYFQGIKNFIDTVTGENSWRKRRKDFKKL